ncbi:MAG: DUF1735 domain-containing protein [Bacteroidetes bacterium]|nr:DUF1735 domain-containing protein [Bacteroidota bacterium]
MKLNIKKSLILISAISVSAVGCLKDKEFDNGQIQSVHNTGAAIKPVEIKLTASSTDNFLAQSFDLSNKDTTINLVPVNLATNDPASEDIQVTLTLNQTLLDDYNNNNGTDYAIPDPSLYTLSNGGVVTIPKGQHTGYLQLTFNPANYIGVDYAFPFTISSIDKQGYTISGNLKDGISAVGIKNAYDGLYSLRQKQVGWAAYGIADGETNDWPNAISFVTTGSSSNGISTTQGGTLQPAFTPGGGITVFGATEPRFVFDPATNLVTSVYNNAPDDGRGRAFQLNPAITDSRYDPATKTIYVAYIMKQNGRPNQFLYDTLVYVGSR